MHLSKTPLTGGGLLDLYCFPSGVREGDNVSKTVKLALGPNCKELSFQIFKQRKKSSRVDLTTKQATCGHITKTESEWKVNDNIRDKNAKRPSE